MAAKNKSGQAIPLLKALATPNRPPANPIEVFKLARKAWLAGKRISIGELADAVGVSRVTLYRWVESKDRLVEEILWSFAKPSFENAVKEAPGIGAEHIVEVHHRFMTALATFEPMRRFVCENPNVAIRIQTNDPNTAHGRTIKATMDHLVAQEALGHIRLPVPANRLGEMIVFTNGALLYSALVGGRDPAPAIKQACIIDHLLLQGEFAAKPLPAVKERKRT